MTDLAEKLATLSPEKKKIKRSKDKISKTFVYTENNTTVSNWKKSPDTNSPELLSNSYPEP